MLFDLNNKYRLIQSNEDEWQIDSQLGITFEYDTDLLGRSKISIHKNSMQ